MLPQDVVSTDTYPQPPGVLLDTAFLRGSSRARLRLLAEAKRMAEGAQSAKALTDLGHPLADRAAISAVRGRGQA